MKTQLVDKGTYERHALNDNGKELRIYLQVIQAKNGDEKLSRLVTINEAEATPHSEGMCYTSVTFSHEALTKIHELSEQIANKALGTYQDPKGSQR